MIKRVARKPHGGDVWGFSRKHGIPIDNIMDFSAPINPLGPSPEAVKAVERYSRLVRFYSDQNPIELKISISEYIKGISPENIILGNGSAELIYLFLDVFARSHEVLIPVPSFTEYERAALRVDAKPLTVEMTEDFSLDVNKIKNAISDKIRALIICNPHSPSGRLFSQDSILELIEFCNGKNIYVIVDENYMDFISPSQDYTVTNQVHKYLNLFVLRSFSKFFGMPGLRLGYGIANKEIIELLEDLRVPWNVNVLSIIAGQAALKDKPYIEETKIYIKRERERLKTMLSEAGPFKVFPSEVNFLLVKILNKEVTAGELKDKLAKRGILIRSCEDFRGLGDSYFRVSIRKAEENIMLVQALKEIMNKT
ncbi:MAG: histidinol-phosphate transaminase [Candidatus Bathyarchaeia archaeon]